MVTDESLNGAWIEISSARVVRHTAIEHLVDPYHQCVRTGNDSPFVPDSLFESATAYSTYKTKRGGCA